MGAREPVGEGEQWGMSGQVMSGEQHETAPNAHILPQSRPATSERMRREEQATHAPWP